MLCRALEWSKNGDKCGKPTAFGFDGVLQINGCHIAVDSHVEAFNKNIFCTQSKLNVNTVNNIPSLKL